MKLTKEQTQALVDFYNTLSSVPSSVKEIFESMKGEVYPDVEEAPVEEAVDATDETITNEVK